MVKVTIPVVRIMRDGRITIDKNVRDSYGIVEGSMWKLTLEKIETKLNIKKNNGSDALVRACEGEQFPEE